MSSRLSHIEIGTLFEAAGLLLSIVFHSGILSLFNATKEVLSCGQNETSTIISILNDTMTENLTNSTMKPDLTEPANVVIIK